MLKQSPSEPSALISKYQSFGKTMGKISPWKVYKKNRSIWNEFLNCTHFSFQEMTDKLDPKEQMTVFLLEKSVN